MEAAPFDTRYTITLIALPDGEDGYEVWWNYDHIKHFAGYVHPDSFGGWRPYSVYGKCMNSGYEALTTPLAAAGWGRM